MYLSADTAVVPVYAYLFGLCRGGDKEARAAEGALFGCQKNITVPPLGRLGIRPCAMKLPVDIHRHRTGGEAGEAIVNLYPAAGALSEEGYYSAGIHPWQLETLQGPAVDEELQRVERLLQQPNVLALGEVGMDKNISVPPEVQKRVLEAQLELAERYGKPVIFHSVKFTDELIRLKKTLRPSAEWIIHGFRGKAEMARQLTGIGFGLSFGERYNRQALEATPLSNLFIETDESAVSVEELYRRAAEIREVPPEDFEELIKKNIERAFFSGKSCIF